MKKGEGRREGEGGRAEPFLRPEISPKIADDVIHVISADEEPIELVFIMVSDIFPDASRLLPHVVVSLGTLVMDLQSWD